MGGETRSGRHDRLPDPVVCPDCGSSELAPVLYGYPAWSPKLEADLDAGRMVLGGCMVYDDESQPTHRCRTCGNEFQVPSRHLGSGRTLPDPKLDERLSALAAFLPVFERDDFEFGTWAGGTTSASGAIRLPYYAFGPDAERFLAMAYDCEWVTPFDWGTWSQTPEGRRLREGGEAVDRATPEDLAHLLAALIRAERSCDGVLAGAFESGLLLAIVRRAAVLASQDSPRELVSPDGGWDRDHPCGGDAG